MQITNLNLREIVPDPSLLDIWEDWNKSTFDGSLTPCWVTPICATEYGKHAGYWVRQSRTIQLLHTHWESRHGIILHEMVHQWVSDNHLDGMTMRWSKDFGRGKREGDWNIKDLDTKHDTPEWLLGVSHAMKGAGITDKVPYIRKRLTDGIAPVVLNEDGTELRVLKPGTLQYEGKNLVPAKWFPWSRKLERMIEEGWEF